MTDCEKQKVVDSERMNLKATSVLFLAPGNETWEIILEKLLFDSPFPSRILEIDDERRKIFGKELYAIQLYLRIHYMGIHKGFSIGIL